MALILQNVSKKFGETVAVDDIELTVQKGELVSLLGPSGCGKTTTLRIISGFCSPDRGNIYMNNKLLNNVLASERNTVMVFQNYALFPHKTVYENLAFGLRVRKFPAKDIQKKIKEILCMLRIEGLSDRFPKALSGGQQQRVALGRAIIVEPEILLFDEPLSNLDAKLRIEMRLEIKRLQKMVGITAIYVTHDQEEALVISDRIAVMNQGVIEQVGTPVQIYEEPKTRFVAEFIGAANFFEGTFTGSVENANHQIDTELGLLSISCCHRILVKSGERCNLMVRPEAIKVISPGESVAENIFSAAVDDIVYLGANTRLTCRVNNLSFLMEVQNSHGRHLKLGDMLSLSINPRSIHILNSDKAH